MVATEPPDADWMLWDDVSQSKLSLRTFPLLIGYAIPTSNTSLRGTHVVFWPNRARVSKMMDTIMKTVIISFMSMIFWGQKKQSKTPKSVMWSLLMLIHRSRNRYLILDVLGQGTFGQVVKCQNLKTGEVVAVKVIKNRTAYFNQSMMEVSVLDLVSLTSRDCTGIRLIVVENSWIPNWTKTMTTTSFGWKIRSSIGSICVWCLSCSVSTSTSLSSRTNSEAWAQHLFAYSHSSCSMHSACLIKRGLFIVTWNPRISCWRSKLFHLWWLDCRDEGANPTYCVA